MEQDPRRSIARLAAAVVAADGRVTPDEIAALGRLDHLGLGLLSGAIGEELGRAAKAPIDLRATCDALASSAPQAAPVVLAVLSDLAAADRTVSPGELEVLARVGALLGLSPAQAEEILAAAVEGRHARVARTDGNAPERRVPAGSTFREAAAGGDLGRAFRVLGLEPGADAGSIEAAYLDLVARYDPAGAARLGPEFVALAVHKLARITNAYETLVAAVERPL